MGVAMVVVGLLLLQGNAGLAFDQQPKHCVVHPPSSPTDRQQMVCSIPESCMVPLFPFEFLSFPLLLGLQLDLFSLSFCIPSFRCFVSTPYNQFGTGGNSHQPPAALAARTSE